MPQLNPFEQYRESIMLAAGELYRAERDGLDPDPDASRVNILAQDLGDLSDKDLHKARYAEAELNVAARTVGRLAVLQDDVESGGFKGTVARLEIGLTRVMDRRYIAGVLNPGGIVDIVRGISKS